MPTIYVDGKAYEVKEGQNCLQAVLSLGFNLEYFCWHPALQSVGACRQCAVVQYRDEEGERQGKGKLVMACMTPAAEGTRIAIEAIDAREFRATVIEWLMVNHPHDCPVCDEGGECHLQDMTLMSTHNYRRYRFRKRTHRNQDLGPFINHEMNRSIACYRCARFNRGNAGGEDLDVFGAHNNVYFGRKEDGVLESPFAGNLVEVCPTGVFTDKTLMKKYTRKWDLLSAPSVCHHCSLGCNTLVGTRYGEARRILNRYNRQVNGYFLCDRGRFGYEFVNSVGRVMAPRVAGKPATGEEAVVRAAELLRSGKGIGIGSPRGSLEANYALRTLVGEERFFSGMSSLEQRLVGRVVDILRNGPVRAASLHEVEQADAVLVLGEDLTNTAPMLDYAVRQASRNKPSERAVKMKIPLWDDAAVREVIHDEVGPFFAATPAATALDKIATGEYRGAPDDIARFGFAIARQLSKGSAVVPDLPSNVQRLAERAADELRGAKRPVVISGTSLGSAAIVEAAASVAWGLQEAGCEVKVVFVVPECNSVGGAMAGGRGLDEAVAAVEQGGVETLVVLENDLYRRARRDVVDGLLEKVQHVVVIDHIEHETARRAEVLLPAATYAEGDGTLINNEGRAQRFFQPTGAPAGIQESWRWLRDLAKRVRHESNGWRALDEVAHAAFLNLPGIGLEVQPAPDASFRVVEQRIPRAPHRYSGRTAEHANVTVHEPKPPADPDTPMAFSMEGYRGKPPDGALIPFFWSPGWNSVQATMRYQKEVGGELRGGDPGVRLLEPKAGGKASHSKEVPDRFVRREGEWLCVPLYHVFGSEELSNRAEGIRTLVPEAYVGIGSGEAEERKIEGGMVIGVVVTGEELRLPVRVVEGLPPGVIGLPSGLPGVGVVVEPMWVKLQLGVRA